MTDSIIIRKAESIDDYRACQDAQREAWGIVDENYVVPIATMVGAQHHGGLVLGAFLPDGRAAGLSFAFLGRVDDRWCLYSQLTGVIPGYQGQGIGGKIKEFQREYARSIGLNFIAWAFDPLQAGNAYFNLHRLGATSNRYLENMYGIRTDALNAGVPTDRLIAEWPVDPVVQDRKVYSTDLPKLFSMDASASVTIRFHEPFLVEIPASIASLRNQDPELAETWRSSLSQVLRMAFEGGYHAVDVIREGDRSFYVLDRPKPLQ